MVEHTRILVAPQFVAEREALAGTLRLMRPTIEVVEVEPEALDAQVVALRPDIVVCSALTEVVETRVAAWAELYPNQEPRAVLSLAGRRWDTPNISFAQLLDFIDAACARCYAEPAGP